MINPKYNKLDNETDYEYGLRLISIKIEEKPDDLDWSDIVELLDLDCHKDSLRKAFKHFLEYRNSQGLLPFYINTFAAADAKRQRYIFF